MRRRIRCEASHHSTRVLAFGETLPRLLRSPDCYAVACHFATWVGLPMTRVSWRGRALCNAMAPNPLQTLRCAPLAHRVHESSVTVAFTLLSMLLTGCVIPPSLEVDQQDAGQNSAPIITAVRSNTEQIREPGPLKVIRGASAGSLSVEVVDTDTEDRLFVRLYVDYTIEEPQAARAECLASGGGIARRDCAADLTALCTSDDVAAPPEDLPLVNVKVFDREPMIAGDPPFQAMVEGGLSSGFTFRLDCDDPIE